MKEFSKGDLRTGMIVKFKNGEMAILIGADFVKKHEVIGWEYYASTLDYEEDLTDAFLDRRSIVEVYSFNERCYIKDVLITIYMLDELIEKSYVELIWKRERKIDWWNKVPMWTKVLVRNNNEEEWMKAYFLYEADNGDYPYYVTFCDRFTYNEVFDKCYSQIKPFDEKDIKEEWYFKEDGENANE